MSAPINDGGPAFPSVMKYGTLIPGLTVRDYFAGQAIQAYIATSVENARVGKMFDTKTLALGCYQFADAMIAEREKGKQ